MNTVVKERNVKRTKKLANGEIKTYDTVQKYRCKTDRTNRPRIIFTDEQKADIQYKLNLGVTRKKIMEEYNCSYTCLQKIFPTG